MCPVAMRNAAPATHAAATAAATRSPPSSRAVRPATTTHSPVARAGTTRSAVGETPNRAACTPASHGVNGGLSTYPGAGCRPDTR
jgi:hypothetical protein